MLIFCDQFKKKMHVILKSNDVMSKHFAERSTESVGTIKIY